MANQTRTQKIKELEQKRFQTTRDWLANLRDDQARRLQATRELFGEPVTIIDPHTHSNYSDGKATVTMNRDAGLAAGLDLVFATDHHSLGQKRSIRNINTMSWGQEPGGESHHIGLLNNTRLFKPGKDSIQRDFEKARRLAPFVWIPHPAGWYPATEYSEEQMAELWDLAPAFAMEVLNGAHRIGTAYDRFDEAAVKLWDRLLADGIQTTPLGGSDAHIPESIGCCWTALPGCKADVESIIKGLNAGNCLAGEAPLLSIWVDDQPMGAVVNTNRRRRLTLRYRVVDAAGIQCVRIIAGGQVRKTLYPRDARVVEGDWSFAPNRQGYVRVETRAVDNRRAFSGPIYIN